MAIIAHESEREFAMQVADTHNGINADIIIGSPLDAVMAISSRSEPPRYLIIDIGERQHDILPEIDTIAEYCEVGTRVVVIGTVNDVSFYRELRARGVSEYFTKPAKIADVRAALYSKNITVSNAVKGNGKVLAFMSAASGDGASTVALNTAYALATEHRKSVVLVDMDYQFGMVAKNLDLTTPFGIKELFDNPDRGIDSTLIERMIVSYKNSRLKIIAAPNGLHNIPHVEEELVYNLITTLKNDYDFVVLDLPHIWTPLVSSALTQSNHAVMVAQLWLRSITHSSRLLAAWRSVGIRNNQISLVANRSGSKFKEAVRETDFERVCGLPFTAHFSNDTKSVIAAENNGRTIIEGSNSDLLRQFKEFAAYFGKQEVDSNADVADSLLKSKFSSLLKK